MRWHAGYGLQRAYWTVIKRFYPAQRIGTLEFIDARAKREPPTADIAAAVSEAVRRLSWGGEEFSELVAQHLRLVAALGRGRVGIWRGVAGYISCFDEAERNPHYLASRLVWAAHYLKVLGQAPRQDKEALSAARKAATSLQVRFLAGLPDGTRWVDYIQRHGP
ncbi:MAG: hypothetical protein ABR998_05985 [Gemmatimonadales bacterium]|jgi:nucleotide-binding universal stress UspA family protein